VKAIPLLLAAPTFTTMFPVVAPPGTGATILVGLQFDGAATEPLKMTLLAPGLVPKLTPVIVTEVPTGPEAGFILAMLGGVIHNPIRSPWMSSCRENKRSICQLSVLWGRRYVLIAFPAARPAAEC